MSAITVLLRQITATAEQLRADVPWLPAGVRNGYVQGSPCGRDDGHPDGWRLTTPSGEMRLRDGDWIITWPDGSQTACSQDQFEMRFEVID
jgi:hypothetical protein